MTWGGWGGSPLSWPEKKIGRGRDFAASMTEEHCDKPFEQHMHFTVVVKQPPELYMYTTPSSSLHPSLHPPLAGTTQEKEICHHTPSASTHSLQIQLTSMNESSGCYSYTKNGQVNHNYPYITVLFFS